MIWLLLILFIPPIITQGDIFGGINVQVMTSSPLEPVIRSSSTQFRYPCDSSFITVSYKEPLPERQNQYNLLIDSLPIGTNTLILKFDSEASLELKRPVSTEYKLKKLAVPKNSFRSVFSENPRHFNIQVFGPASGTIPYVQSILADYQELCKNPLTGYFDKYIEVDYEVPADAEEFGPSLDKSCGRRKVTHTELIVDGQPTKSGDWPWHVAILRFERISLKYICGGTLLSKTLVLTAAHCASIGGNAIDPDALSVHLGKHNLIGGDIGAQERGVFEVIIHPEFDGNTLINDIALLKLKSEAVFTDYVQPACLWHEQASVLPIRFGTVVGWEFDHNDLLSSTLQQITIPIVSELTCLMSNRNFSSQNVDNKKFCAGFANGTSVCNSDSGGGLMIFVPDTAGDSGNASGAWYVRGIASLDSSRNDTNICDPHQYTIFTDVEKYREWLSEYLF